MTGLSLQTVCDIRGFLYAQGVGEVPCVDVILDTAEALREQRVAYNGASCQVLRCSGCIHQYIQSLIVKYAQRGQKF